MATRRSGTGELDPQGRERPEVEFRPLRGGDLQDVLAIERRLFSNPWDESAFRIFLRDGPSFSRVALIAGEPAGYALGWCGRGEAELMNLAVDSRRQGLGIGSLLIAWALAECARRRADEMFLEVRASNERARHLYELHGFRQCGRRRGYYSNPSEDALILRASLRSPES